MHVFKGGALLIQLRLQYRVVHEVDASQSTHHGVIRLVGRIVSLMVSYSYHLLVLVRCRLPDHRGVHDCVQVSAVVVQGAVTTATHTSVLIERICFVHCRLGTCIHSLIRL